MKEDSYSTLTQEKRPYEIMLLRDQCGYSFVELGRKYGLTTARVHQIYSRTKVRQARLYIDHIAAALSLEDSSPIRKIYEDALNCYQDYACANAYLETKYPDILAEYRAGEPGTPPWFLKSMPPFRKNLSKKTVARLVEMHEAEGASFSAIAAALRITPAKAKHAYDWFYHERTLRMIQGLQKRAGSPGEKRAIWDRFFEKRLSPKKRYELLAEECPQPK